MILQALKEYYDRKAADPDSDIAPEGWIPQKIDYVIVIDQNGDYVQIKDLRENNVGHPALVPNIGKQASKHSNSGKDANLLWDKPGFIFGLGKKGHIKLSSFIETLDLWFPKGVDEAIDAVRTYLLAGKTNRSVFDPIINHTVIGEGIRSDRGNITFKILGDDGFVFERTAVKNKISLVNPTNKISEGAICLVTGSNTNDIVDCHPVISGLFGAKKSPNLVSFNEEAFCSSGKKKSFNAPLCKKAVDAYTKALSRLINSKQKLRVCDATTVFWSDKNTDFESQVVNFFSEPPKDDPDRNVEAVRVLHESVQKGLYVESDKDTRFFVLGLAPNAARIAVRFWHVGTVPEMATRFDQHFEDLKIVHGPWEKDSLPLFRLLLATASQSKADNIPPNIAADMMRSILEGTPYPATLLHAAVRRIRAEQAKKNKLTGKQVPNVTYERAALIKACLNRSLRFNNSKNEREITMCIDPENINIGYRLGRLFATLEKIQSEANPGINATIRDRFYGAASSTPVTVFGNLMRLSNHHLSKLEKEKKGLFVVRKQLIGEIMCPIVDFPPHLDMANQGRFAIGYYHQMQDFYKK